MPRVSGYTRSNGTRVASYTRSAPTTSSTKSSSSVVHVSGYTRSNGTHVAAYTRSAPTTSSTTSSSSVVHVSEYTRSNGTHVAAYTRSAPTSSTSSTSSTNSTKSFIPLVHVSGYTKSNGTRVAAYTRSAPHLTLTTSKLFKHKITTNISRFVNSRNVQRLQIFNSDDISDFDNINNFDEIKKNIIDNDSSYKQIHHNSLINYDELICPISCDIFINPVKLTCSHTFSEEYIRVWLAKNKTCPICRYPNDISNIVVDDEKILLLEQINYEY